MVLNIYNNMIFPVSISRLTKLIEPHENIPRNIVQYRN